MITTNNKEIKTINACLFIVNIHLREYALIFNKYYCYLFNYLCIHMDNVYKQEIILLL